MANFTLGPNEGEVHEERMSGEQAIRAGDQRHTWYVYHDLHLEADDEMEVNLLDSSKSGKQVIETVRGQVFDLDKGTFLQFVTPEAERHVESAPDQWRRNIKWVIQQ